MFLKKLEKQLSQKYTCDIPILKKECLSCSSGSLQMEEIDEEKDSRKFQTFSFRSLGFRKIIF